MSLQKRIERPLFPSIICIVPVLVLLDNNIREIQPDEALRVFLLSMAGVFLVVTLLNLIFRTLLRAALICLALETLFLSYGHIYEAI